MHDRTMQKIHPSYFCNIPRLDDALAMDILLLQSSRIFPALAELLLIMMIPFYSGRGPAQSTKIAKNAKSISLPISNHVSKKVVILSFYFCAVSIND